MCWNILLPFRCGFIWMVISYTCLYGSVNAEVNVDKSVVYGIGLKPANVVLSARYFFVQFADNDSLLTTSPKGKLEVWIGRNDATKHCRVWTNVLDRNDGSYIVRYKLYEPCDSLRIDLRYDNRPFKGFPLIVSKPILSDDCVCPQPLHTWAANMECPESYRQIEEDLKPFKGVDMTKLRKVILDKFNKRGSMSICHYIVVDNQVHRKCYGQYVGFHIFMDAILLSLARKVKLPPLEFFVNLGDWPLEGKSSSPVPVFSWCGSKDKSDIVMPTYDITESTLEAMGRVQLDMLSVQGNTGPSWFEKTPKAFWRGRDSRQERLDLVDIARANPDMFNASLTNFFFFRDKEEEYGPKQPHVSFFEFFQYKYQISIDGTVAAYRLPYLLAGDSLVLKQDSPYYEHFYSDLEPGIHFLPVKRDLSDLKQQVEWAKTHDEEARKIAKTGQALAREKLMPANIFCYHVVLFNEWSKRLTHRVEPLEGMEVVPQPPQAKSCSCTAPHDEL